MEESDSLKRCSKCNSNQTYIRIKTKELVCQKCGNIESMKEKDEHS